MRSRSENYPPQRSQREDRAQPGDVLGIEEDGKVTELGDDAEDEHDRLEDAEEDAGEDAGDETRP